jgi:hypothetical protein
MEGAKGPLNETISDVEDVINSLPKVKLNDLN